MRSGNGVLHMRMNPQDALEAVNRGWLILDGVRYTRLVFEDGQPDVVRCDQPVTVVSEAAA